MTPVIKPKTIILKTVQMKVSRLKTHVVPLVQSKVAATHVLTLKGMEDYTIVECTTSINKYICELNYGGRVFPKC